MKFEIRCSICGEEMEYEELSISPGSSMPCLSIKPCCDTEETSCDLEENEALYAAAPDILKAL